MKKDAGFCGMMKVDLAK